jgi:hypothetical protein
MIIAYMIEYTHMEGALEYGIERVCRVSRRSITQGRECGRGTLALGADGDLLEQTSNDLASREYSTPGNPNGSSGAHELPSTQRKETRHEDTRCCAPL